MNPNLGDQQLYDETFLLEQVEEHDRFDLETDAYHARSGRDIQSIDFISDFSRGGNTSFSRSNARMRRMMQLQHSTQFNDYKGKTTPVNDNFYSMEFYYNMRTNVDLNYYHFQLRHVLVSTGADLLFFSNGSGVSGMRSSYWGKDKNYGIHIQPVIDSAQVDSEQRNFVVTSVGAYDRYVMCGGMGGELVCKNIQTDQIIHAGLVSQSQNSIVNYINIGKNGNGVRSIVCGNDNTIRFFDVLPAELKLNKEFKFEYCINHASISNDGKLLLVAGDHQDIKALDLQTGKEVFKLSRHADFPFSTSFNPQVDYQFASGAQDYLTVIWDLRKLDSVHLLKGLTGPICSVKYSEDGSLLVSNEPCDNVHIYDVASFSSNTHGVREQLLDIFGEICGSTISHNDKLFVGIDDRNYRSILEFRRVRPQILQDLYV